MLTPVKTRIVDAAIELFAEHGVGGTSLQMIADRIGVTKAAVYHQYRTKDEIVLAAGQAELARLEAVLDAADGRDDLLVRIVDLAVERRRTENSLLGDPVLMRFFAAYRPYHQVMQRLHRLLMGDDAGPQEHIRAAMLLAAIGGAVMHPLVADVGEDAMRSELVRLARAFLDLPGLDLPA